MFMCAAVSLMYMYFSGICTIIKTNQSQEITLSKFYMGFFKTLIIAEVNKHPRQPLHQYLEHSQA